jgi:hypothetical protein
MRLTCGPAAEIPTSIIQLQFSLRATTTRAEVAIVAAIAAATNLGN